MDSDTNKAYIGALAKGISVLRFIAESEDPAGITQLSKALHLSIGAVQRVTYTLSELGYLRKAASGQGYILGPKGWALGLSIVNKIDLRNIAHPYLKDLSDSVGEIVSLGIVEGPEMIYLDRIKTRHILNLNLNVGARLPAHSTSLGKAVLAFLPEPELAAFLDRFELKPFTRNTITDRSRFREELRRIRKRGFAVNNAETDNGIRSVAAPVRDQSGWAVASINISVPSIRVTLEDLQTRFAREVTRVAGAISEALGFRRNEFNPAGPSHGAQTESRP
jgi:IclR family transcriptional regulator, pca regulon regulatory protein